MILKGAQEARGEHVDGVVSVGGGSSLDTAKLIAMLLGTEQPLTQMYGINQVRGDRLPLILAPTTAGTGSEVTPISIVTTGESEKMAILDASLTTGLPCAVTAATGIDAMVHAIEAYTSKRLKNVVSDCLAKQALTMLGANLRIACETPENLKAREEMLIGSMLAGMAFTNAPVAAVHALAYPLGGHFHVPHGLSNALVLPHVMEFNLPEAKDLYDDLAPIIFPKSAKTAQEMINIFKTFGSDLGLPANLKEVGVKPEDIEMLAKDAMKQERLLINNPKEMTLDAAQEIYQRAM